MKNLRGDLRTIVIAHGVSHALFAHNSDKVDGLDAVKAGAANKNKTLVATDATGKFPVSVIPKADADTLDGQNSSEFLAIDAKAADSDLLDGLNSTSFALASHAHDGAAIVSGTVADARIASTIARDTEIMSTVLAADGSGSTLDADLLDGKQLTDIETTYREVNGNTNAVDLDTATPPVLCQTAAYTADAGDRARVFTSASLANQGGAASISYTLDPVFSTNGGTVWNTMAGNFGRESVGINEWGNGAVFGDAFLTPAASYIFRVQVGRDGVFGGSVDPTLTRCHLIAEIDEDL